MELNSIIPTEPPRDAATMVMLRDAAEGLQVFLVRRHGLSDVMGGAYVFPGGKLDPADCELDAASHIDQDRLALHRLLGESDLPPERAQGLYVAAIREAFEESRVLFTADRAKVEQALTFPTSLPFNTLLEQLAVRLQTSNVLPWSRWITPRMPAVSAKRFDTRFFVAAVPDSQHARHDDHEMTDSVWLAPRTALEHYRAGLIELAPPQIMSLAHLSRHRTLASVLDEARSRLPPLIFPETFDQDGLRVLCYPGDRAHPVAQQALPGPTRLVFRNQRFEPEAGFDELLT